ELSACGELDGAGQGLPLGREPPGFELVDDVLEALLGAPGAIELLTEEEQRRVSDLPDRVPSVSAERGGGRLAHDRIRVVQEGRDALYRVHDAPLGVAAEQLRAVLAFERAEGLRGARFAEGLEALAGPLREPRVPVRRSVEERRHRE